MDKSTSNAAICYVPEAYVSSDVQRELVGRRVAGEELLRAFARHADADRFYCFSPAEPLFKDFQARVRQASGRSLPCHWIPWSAWRDLATPGCLYLPDPRLADHAWLRRGNDQRAYSLCGVTHTTADNGFYDAVGAYLIAPLQEWDALICTSRAVKDSVEKMLADWSDYLADRFGKRVSCAAERPVIPLGVDCDRLAPTPAARRNGMAMRSQMGVPPEGIVVLYVGRFSFNGKANPYPMLVALERVARNTRKPICLVQAGWFNNAANRDAFVKACAQFAPSVKCIFVDGREEAVRQGIWHAADIFTSLVDNIQETFGLTPIEAMAAGLPVVVTDWNGYRDTVVDGETGYRVPTCMPAPGPGEELALRHDAGVDDYAEFLTYACASTVVDIAACEAAYTRLVQDPELRRRMGEAGRRRALAHYDWRKIVVAYQQLWRELSQRRHRRDAGEIMPHAPGAPVHPLRQDPYALFGGYPTTAITDQAVLRPADASGLPSLAQLRESDLFRLAMPMLLSTADTDAVMRKIHAGGKVGLGHLLRDFAASDHHRVRRTVGWLLKTGLLRVDTGTGDG